MRTNISLLDEARTICTINILDKERKKPVGAFRHMLLKSRSWKQEKILEEYSIYPSLNILWEIDLIWMDKHNVPIKMNIFSIVVFWMIWTAMESQRFTKKKLDKYKNLYCTGRALKNIQKPIIREMNKIANRGSNLLLFYSETAKYGRGWMVYLITTFWRVC